MKVLDPTGTQSYFRASDSLWCFNVLLCKLSCERYQTLSTLCLTQRCRTSGCVLTTCGNPSDLNVVKAKLIGQWVHVMFRTRLRLHSALSVVQIRLHYLGTPKNLCSRVSINVFMLILKYRIRKAEWKLPKFCKKNFFVRLMWILDFLKKKLTLKSGDGNRFTEKVVT